VYSVSSTQLIHGAEVVNYDRGLDSLTVNGGSGADTFHILGEVEGSTSIRGGDGDDTFYLPVTQVFTYAQIDTGPGDDRVFVGATALGSSVNAPATLWRRDGRRRLGP